MRRLSHLVNYDFDHDTFYRVENNGHHEPTHFNGSPIKHFQPNVTGQNYLNRKSNQLGKSIDFNTSHQNHFRTERTINDFIPMNTLDQSSKSINKVKGQFGRPYVSSFSSTKYSSKLFSSRKRGRDMQLDVGEGELSHQKSNEKIKQDKLNQTLTDYSRLLKQQINTNHSPKNGEIPGSEPTIDPLATLCTTLGTFRIREPSWDQKINQTTLNLTERKLQSNRSKKRKMTKERQLFLAFHPINDKQKEAKRDSILKERKKNLKILEALFIRQKNRGTRHIYHSPA